MPYIVFHPLDGPYDSSGAVTTGFSMRSYAAGNAAEECWDATAAGDPIMWNGSTQVNDTYRAEFGSSFAGGLLNYEGVPRFTTVLPDGAVVDGGKFMIHCSNLSGTATIGLYIVADGPFSTFVDPSTNYNDCTAYYKSHYDIAADLSAGRLVQVAERALSDAVSGVTATFTLSQIVGPHINPYGVTDFYLIVKRYATKTLPEPGQRYGGYFWPSDHQAPTDFATATLQLHYELGGGMMGGNF